MENIVLSVVIIAKNEEKTIAKALAAVVVAIEEARKAKVIETSEIIFVDSASTDKTVEIVRQFPVKIIELPDTWPLSASAGIYCGYRESKGEFFAVVDGDVEVNKYWFRDALPYLQNDDDVADVYGWWEESSQGQGHLLATVSEMLNSSKVAVAEEIESTGNGIFRRSSLESIGGHNPYLKGAEDRDISFRLRQAGYKLLDVPVQFGVHHWHLNYLEYYRSVRAWSKGEGHAAAYARSRGNTELFAMYEDNYPSSVFWRVMRQLVLFVTTATSVLAGTFHSQEWLFVGFFLLSIVIFQIFKGKRKGKLRLKLFLYHYLNRIPYIIYRHWYYAKGKKLPTPDPKTYPE
jgi:glycosyltransferase involved in cell wall biosynthesis